MPGCLLSTSDEATLYGAALYLGGTIARVIVGDSEPIPGAVLNMAQTALKIPVRP